MTPELLLHLHLTGAILVVAIGIGVTLAMLLVLLRQDASLTARIGAFAVPADVIFAAAVMLAQPFTGLRLARMTGFYFTELWIFLSMVLLFLTGACWLPVVWMQIRIRDQARAAAAAGKPLPEDCRRMIRKWFLFCLPGLVALSALIWLMYAKPTI